MRFWLIILSFPVFDIAWWVWAHRKLAVLPKAKRWQRLLSIFIIAQLLSLTFLFVARFSGLHAPYPVVVLAALYIWHLIVLPITVLLSFLGELASSFTALARRILPGSASADAPDAPIAGQPLGRRQFLTAAAVAAPPFLTGAAVTTSLLRLPQFRHRDLTLNVPDLPPALDGLTIAHVSDIHVGRFTPPSKLAEIVEQTNARNPDLVLMTGDLIDFALLDLPRAIELVKQFTPRFGLVMCEGNHDLIENRFVFEQDVKASGIPLLLNESQVIDVKGHPVQLLGIRWGGRSGFDPATNAHVERTLRLRRRDAFPILLAHHPHAFDPAAEAGIPLTLAGHTHGGQLMLTEQIGPGPLMYKYWSGPYRKERSHLVVSNGVGNWFPLRVNAPAEIVHLTLRGA
jgi:hypothetical protein